MKTLLMALMLLLSFSCQKEREMVFEGALNCSELREALYSADPERLKRTINPILNQNKKEQDNFGQLQKELDGCPDISVLEFCYQCIYTLPVQSEIKLLVEVNGVKKEVSIDFQSENDRLTLLRVH